MELAVTKQNSTLPVSMSEPIPKHAGEVDSPSQRVIFYGITVNYLHSHADGRSLSLFVTTRDTYVGRSGIYTLVSLGSLNQTIHSSSTITRVPLQREILMLNARTYILSFKSRFIESEAEDALHNHSCRLRNARYLCCLLILI